MKLLLYDEDAWMVGWPSESLGKIFDVIREKRQFYVYYYFFHIRNEKFSIIG